MKKIILCILTFLLTSCFNKSTKTDVKENVQNKKNVKQKTTLNAKAANEDFDVQNRVHNKLSLEGLYCYGSEPFWNLDFSENKKAKFEDPHKDKKYVLQVKDSNNIPVGSKTHIFFATAENGENFIFNISSEKKGCYWDVTEDPSHLEFAGYFLGLKRLGCCSFKKKEP